MGVSRTRDGREQGQQGPEAVCPPPKHAHILHAHACTTSCSWEWTQPWTIGRNGRTDKAPMRYALIVGKPAVCAAEWRRAASKVLQDERHCCHRLQRRYVPCASSTKLRSSKPTPGTTTLPPHRAVAGEVDGAGADAWGGGDGGLVVQPDLAGVGDVGHVRSRDERVNLEADPISGAAHRTQSHASTFQNGMTP